MRYLIRDGIVLKKVCDVNLLIATCDALETCPVVKTINETGAYYWRLLEDDVDLDTMAEMAAHDYEVSAEEILPGILRFMDGLESENYIFKVE